MSSWRVALTFDAEHPDRPSEGGTTERLLEMLSREGITATSPSSSLASVVARTTGKQICVDEFQTALAKGHYRKATAVWTQAIVHVARAPTDASLYTRYASSNIWSRLSKRDSSQHASGCSSALTRHLLQ